MRTAVASRRDPEKEAVAAAAAATHTSRRVDEEQHSLAYVVHDDEKDRVLQGRLCCVLSLQSQRCWSAGRAYRTQKDCATTRHSERPTNTSILYAQTLAAHRTGQQPSLRPRAAFISSPSLDFSAMAALAYPDPPELDHIIHLVPTGKLHEASKQFQRLGFSVESGGVHADGLTQNALIVLTDGVYIELIEFLDKPPAGTTTKETLAQWKERRSRHWWWDRRPGWIDWCLRGGKSDGCVEAVNRASDVVVKARTAHARGAEDDSEDVNEKKQDTVTEKSGPPKAHTSPRMQDGGSLRAITSSLGRSSAEKKPVSTATSDAPVDLVRYKDSIEGGRRALSGKEIKWHVTFPKELPGVQRGTFPFWCEDQTPRWWRVPTPSPEHPNLSKGLAALTLLYYPETLPSRLASLQLILGSRQAAEQDGNVDELLHSIVDTRPPPKTEGRTALPDTLVEFFLATPEGPLLPLRIKAAQDPSEVHWLEQYGEGLWEVEISVAPEKLPITAPPDGIERETASKGSYGRLRLHPMRAHIAAPMPATVAQAAALATNGQAVIEASETQA